MGGREALFALRWLVIGKLYDDLKRIHFFKDKKNPRIFRYEDF
jgi:hypothetical protein